MWLNSLHIKYIFKVSSVTWPWTEHNIFPSIVSQQSESLAGVRCAHLWKEPKRNRTDTSISTASHYISCFDWQCALNARDLVSRSVVSLCPPVHCRQNSFMVWRGQPPRIATAQGTMIRRKAFSSACRRCANTASALAQNDVKRTIKAPSPTTHRENKFSVGLVCRDGIRQAAQVTKIYWSPTGELSAIAESAH